jgi:hypothetical protein
MARRQRAGGKGTSAGGPLGNAARDLRDDFVGAPAEPITTGKPPRWPPNPKRVKSNTFHSKVTGNTSLKRADRAAHFRKGGWVSGRAEGGKVDEGAEAQKAREDAAKRIRSTRSMPDAFIVGGPPGRKAGGTVEREEKGEREDKRESKREEKREEEEEAKYKKGGALSQVSKETSKGGLHRSLGIPEGQKIGAARIAKATHSSNPKTRKQANLAQTYAKYRG